MNTQEVLTLQFGHYSNYVGTHWWNIQERCFNYSETSAPSEISHDVLFREGLTHKRQVTFTPRLLLVDLKGSLKSLPEQGDLYDAIPEPSKVPIEWDESRVQIQEQESTSKNAFLQGLNDPTKKHVNSQVQSDLLDNVDVWSDYLYTKFHPRTINIIKEYEHETVSSSSFDVFSKGKNLWKSEQFEEDFMDKIRVYIEECDHFQGFQVMLDAVDAFSGLSTSCIESLRDDYGRKSVLAFPIIPSYYNDYNYKTEEERNRSMMNDSIRVLNIMMTYSSLSEHSSMFVPLCTGCTGWKQPGPKIEFHHTSYDPTKPYQTSAILASAIDTFTLKYRLKTGHYSLSDLTADLTPCSRKVASASLCFPFSLNKGAYFLECLDNWQGPLSQSITPNCTIGTERVLQLITLRGISENRLKKPYNIAGPQKNLPAYQCESINEMLDLYLSCNYHASASNVTVVEKALPVQCPFPNMFDHYVGVDGNIQADVRSFDTPVASVPILAGLHSGSNVGKMLESLHGEARRVRYKKLHQFFEPGLEHDELEEALDKLFELRECYEDNSVL